MIDIIKIHSDNQKECGDCPLVHLKGLDHVGQGIARLSY